MNRVRAVRDLGQSIWLDNLSRSLLREGGLARLIAEDGVSGVTSDPSTFHMAVKESPHYADDHARLRQTERDPQRRYEALVIPDIQAACDLLRATFEATGGDDGYVSLEVSPRLAHDEDATVAEARRLRARVGRPNVLIKVPGTPAGERAFERLVAEGINVNVTLLFSLHQTVRIFEAYIRGLKRRADAGEDVRPAKCVASLFLSRVDTAVDKALAALAGDEARAFAGTAAVTVAKLAYQRYREMFSSPAFDALHSAGARSQYLLWASTGTQNPSYSDVMYVEPLIGPETINTVPDATLAAFRDHGNSAATIEDGVGEAESRYVAIERLGVDMNAIGDALQEDGVRLFDEAYAALISLVS